MATTRIATGEWHGTLLEGSGRVTLESSGLGTFDVHLGRSHRRARWPHEPR